MLLLAVLHAFLPRHFRWHEGSVSISLLTRQIFYVHNFFIALTVDFIGLLTLTSAHDLLGSSVGRRILLSFSVFWFVRVLGQLLVYSRKLYRGRGFETGVHALFTVLWIDLACGFLSGYLTGN